MEISSIEFRKLLQAIKKGDENAIEKLHDLFDSIVAENTKLNIHFKQLNTLLKEYV